MRALLICAALVLSASVASAAETLDIYVIDTEGGKSIILVTPDGQSMLVDAGYPTPDDRDTKRIVEAAKAAGIKQFDFILATHYDSDHAGNIPRLDAQIPGKVFVDHGGPLPTLNAGSIKGIDEPYVKAIGERKRISVKPGDTIPVKGLTITVVTAGGKALGSAFPGAGQPNDLAPAARPTYTDRDDNAGSVGLLYEFGKFRMLDLADLLSAVEYDLMCPKNLVGTVDLFMVSHHGFKGLQRQVPGPGPASEGGHHEQRRPQGGRAQVMDILKTSPGFQDLWQLHYSNAAGPKNAPADFVANPKDPCEGKLIKVTVQRDGTFTVTNTRNGFSKTYKP